MPRKLLLLLVAAAALLTTFTPHHSFAQEEAAIPPQIIDVYPLPGVEMIGTETLTISFDQPMEADSVIRALTITPSLDADLAWLDRQTLTVTPRREWVRETTYQFTLGTDAITIDGTPLEASYTFEIDTLGALEVANVSPDPDSVDVNGNGTTIVVSFNRPVVALGESGAPSPITITPELSGRGEWVNTSLYTFTATQDLPPSTEYTVRVASGLQSSDGAVLREDYRWTFRTRDPQVESVRFSMNADTWQTIDPQSVPPDSPYIIVFSDPMDKESVQTAVSITDADGVPVDGRMSWQGDIFVFQPQDLLRIDTEYRVVLNEGARTAEGNPIAAREITTFRTQPPPAVEYTYPKDGETLRYYWESPYIVFNVPMQPSAEISEYVTISPMPQNFRAELFEHRLYLEFDRIPNTTFTVTLKAGLLDSFGNPSRQDYTFTFTTPVEAPNPYAPSPEMTLLMNSDIMINNVSQKDAQFTVLYADQAEWDINLYRMPPDELSLTPLSNYQYVNGQLYFSNGEYSRNRQRCEPPSGVRPENLVRSWTETIDFSTEPDEIPGREVLIASENGGQLPLGLYWLTLGERVSCILDDTDLENIVAETGYKPQFGYAVVSANMTVKRGTDDVFVWLTDLDDASVVVGATVTVYSNGEVIGTAVTAADGTARVPVRVFGNEAILITAEAPDVYAVWYHYWEADWRMFPGAMYDYGTYIGKPIATQGYIYTDRPIYRPGDTIYYRGVLRQKVDVTYPVLQDRTATLIIKRDGVYNWGLESDYKQSVIFEGEIELTEYGTFSGEYVIPEDVQLGMIGIVVLPDEPQFDPRGWRYDTRGGGVVNAHVLQYRPSEFAVKVSPPQGMVFLGDPMEALISASYYFGGGVSNAETDWNLYMSPTSFRYTGGGRYKFGYASWYDSNYVYSFLDPEDNSNYWYLERSDSGVSRTGDDGQTRITLPNTRYDTTSRYGYRRGEQPLFPMRLTVEGVVTDPDSGQTVSGRSVVLAHPANLYIGVQTPARRVETNSTVDLNLIAVTPDSKPIPNQQLRIRVERYYWNQSTWGEFSPLSTEQVVTDSEGKAVARLTTRNSGVYYIIVEGEDEQGRQNRTTYYMWVFGREKLNNLAWQAPDVPIVRLIADQVAYQPGETAQILIPVPFEGISKVLVSVERAGVRHHEVLEANGDTLVYSLPITDAFAPNVYVNATYITPIPAGRDAPEWTLSTSVRLDVQVRKQVLNVQLTPSTDTLRPGEKVTFDVLVTNSDGAPVQAEVGLKLVDKAVLALMPANARRMKSVFYGMQTQHTITDLSVYGLIESLTENIIAMPPGMGGGGGDGDAGVDIRENFVVTPLWSPHILTDANGRAQVTVKLPDNLTTWELDARVLTLGSEMYVGQSTVDIMSTLPLLIRPMTPRFMVAGDRVVLAAVVNNNTPDDQAVRVRLEASGVQIENEVEQTVFIPSGGRQRIEWSVRVEDAEGASLVFYADGENGARDATRPTLTTGPNNTIPIRRFLARETYGMTGGVLREGGSLTEVISLPARLRTEGNEGELIVRVDPSLAASLPDTLTYLRQYPYFCIEQTTSRFLPNTITYAALRDLGLDDAALREGLEEAMGAALIKFANEQNEDGGWGWFGGMESNSLTTGYALLGIIEAKRAGFDTTRWISDEAFEAALNVVVSEMARPTMTLENWQINRHAFLLYVLARHGEVNRTFFDDLFASYVEMDYAARAFLLMAFHERYPNDPAVQTLKADLISGATFNATGIYWDESARDWWNWGTDTRTTAIALAALTRVDPQNTLLPNVVRWLMTVREGSRWQTTQETAWSVVALTDWIVSTGELESSYRYNILFNRDELSDVGVTPESAEDAELRIAVRDLLNSNQLTIARDDGSGSLYYTARFDLYTPASEAQALSRGFNVSRQYFAQDGRTLIDTAQVGDVITVRLTINVLEDAYFFALEDILPAGTEIIDARLLTTSLEDGDTGFRRYGDSRWYWGWWRFRHTEMRDEGLYLYADYLQRGTYVYSYQVRATTQGEFQTIPTYAYTFYQPDVFGRSNGQIFTILPMQQSDGLG
jgi:alpha-2-macroglobulin